MGMVFSTGSLSQTAPYTAAGGQASGAPASRPAAEAIDEAVLLAGLRAGDDAAFRQFVHVYSGRMLAVALRLLRHEADALEAVQEAFLAVCSAFDSDAANVQLSTWLHRLVVHRAITKLCSRQGQPEASIAALLPRFLPDGHHAQPVAAWPEIGEMGWQRPEMQALMRQCLDCLPETYRTVLLLCDIEALNSAETAQLLGISQSIVKTRLHQARLALQTLLAPHLRQGAV